MRRQYTGKRGPIKVGPWVDIGFGIVLTNKSLDVSKEERLNDSETFVSFND